MMYKYHCSFGHAYGWYGRSFSITTSEIVMVGDYVSFEANQSIDSHPGYIKISGVAQVLRRVHNLGSVRLDLEWGDRCGMVLQKKPGMWVETSPTDMANMLSENEEEEEEEGEDVIRR